MDRGIWKLHKSMVLQTVGCNLGTKQSEKKKKKGYKNVLIPRVINSPYPFQDNVIGIIISLPIFK